MITLFVNYFKHPRGQRRVEIDKALELNVKNKHIDRIVVLSNDPVPIESPKIEEYPVEKIPIFKDFTDLFEADSINVLSNADISYNDTIRHVNRMAPADAYCITRHEMNAKGHKIHFAQFHGAGVKPQWSQDTWVINGKCKARIPETVLAQHLVTGEFDHIPFGMGVPGCDNLMAYYLGSVYNLKNPQMQIVCAHHHISQQRPVYSHRMTGARSKWGNLRRVDNFNL